MTSGAKLYVLLHDEDMALVSIGPFKTLPEAKKEVAKLQKRWGRFQIATPPGEPDIRVVKVVEELHVGSGT